MSVNVTINGASRIGGPTGTRILLVDLTIGTSHQQIPFNESVVLAAGDVTAQIDYIVKQALAAATTAACITTIPAGMADIRGTSVVAGAAPMQGVTIPQVTKTADYVLTNSDYALWMDATAGNRIATLPTAVGNAGQRYEIKKTDTSANTVTVTPNGSEKIDGASTVVLSLKGQTAVVTSNGVGWVQTPATVAGVGASATDIGNITDAASKAATTALQAALAARGAVTSPA
jgi:hypothetical protein